MEIDWKASGLKRHEQPASQTVPSSHIDADRPSFA
jgi:hypothetical protein